MKPVSMIAGASIALLSALPATASPPASQARFDPDRTVCVSPRDKAGRPLPGQVCKTAREWKIILAEHLSNKRSTNSFVELEPFKFPNLYYGPEADEVPLFQR